MKEDVTDKDKNEVVEKASVGGTVAVETSKGRDGTVVATGVVLIKRRTSGASGIGRRAHLHRLHLGAHDPGWTRCQTSRGQRVNGCRQGLARREIAWAGYFQQHPPNHDPSPRHTSPQSDRLVPWICRVVYARLDPGGRSAYLITIMNPMPPSRRCVGRPRGAWTP